MDDHLKQYPRTQQALYEAHSHCHGWHDPRFAHMAFFHLHGPWI